jgi:hypothetical protein
MAPELYNGVIAQPFVDVITTMLDDTIPLTTGSTMNGKSNVKKYYDYMLSYSPYECKIILICTFRLDFMIHKYNIGSQQNGLLN